MAFIKSFSIDDYGALESLDYDIINEWILSIVSKYDIELVLGVTPAFIDCHPNGRELISWLQMNQSHVSIAAHGLLHTHDGGATEFFHFDSQVPFNEQKKRLTSMYNWFVEKDIATTMFIPPAHGWEVGVTDRFLYDLGYKELLSREVEKRSISDLRGLFRKGLIKFRYTKSEYQIIRWRVGMFIPYLETDMKWITRVKLHLYKYRKWGIVQLLLLRGLHQYTEELDIFIHVQNLKNPEMRANIEKELSKLMRL